MKAERVTGTMVVGQYSGISSQYKELLTNLLKNQFQISTSGEGNRKGSVDKDNQGLHRPDIPKNGIRDA